MTLRDFFKAQLLESVGHFCNVTIFQMLNESVLVAL